MNDEFRTSAVGPAWQGPKHQLTLEIVHNSLTERANTKHQLKLEDKMTDEEKKKIKAVHDFKVGEEEKKIQKRAHNKRLVAISLTPEQKAMLNAEMDKEGWLNMSGYLTYKLFGSDRAFERRMKTSVKEDRNTTENLLVENIKEYKNRLDYYCAIYDKMIEYLYSVAPLSQVTAFAWEAKIGKQYKLLRNDIQELKKRLDKIKDWSGADI